MIIHHNHDFVVALNGEQQAFEDQFGKIYQNPSNSQELEEMKDEHVSMDFEISSSPFPLFGDGDEEQKEWKGLFHSKENEWMDWEDHLIKETTKARRKTLIFEQKEATDLDQIFDRLSEWKSLPY